jgi:hypothetical protein
VGSSACRQRLEDREATVSGHGSPYLAGCPAQVRGHHDFIPGLSIQVMCSLLKNPVSAVQCVPRRPQDKPKAGPQ